MADNQDKQAQIDSLTTSRNNLQSQASELQGQVNVLSGKIAELKAKLAKAKTSIYWLKLVNQTCGMQVLT